MADYPVAKSGVAYIFYCSLPSQANPLIMQVNPTLATGDVTVSIDGAAATNLTTLPTVTPTGGKRVKVSLSAAEMTGDNISVVFSDVAGAEWCDQQFDIQTSARGIADLAYPATSGRSMVVDAAGLVDSNTVKQGPTGSGTAQTARDMGASVLISPGTGTGQLDVTSGVVKSTVAGYATGQDPRTLLEATGSDLDTLVTRLSAVRAGLLDKLNITGNVAGSAEVTAIQNNTSTRFVVPDFLQRPASGSTVFVLDLYIYDESGNMEAPDSTPTVTVVNESGTDRSANLSALTNPGTGHYRMTYTVTSSATGEQLRFEASVVEGGATRVAGATTWVVDTSAVDFTAADRTTLANIVGFVDDLETRLSGARATLLDNLSHLDVDVSSRTKPADTQAAVTLVTTTTNLTNAPPDSAGVGTLLTRITAAVATATNLSALKAEIDAIAANYAQVGSAMTLTTGERNSVADALLDRVDGVETGYTLRKVLRGVFAFVRGKANGATAGAGTLNFRDPADTKDRITMTVDTNGNRTAVEDDLT